MTYTELEKLPAEAYLNPETFRTDYPHDKVPERMQANYERGLAEGKSCERFTISCRSVWSSSRPGSVTSSYEGIGYHCGTADFLRGILDSGCEVWVFRYGQDGGKRIK